MNYPDNPHGKAGALNLGWQRYAQDADLVVCADADTILPPNAAPARGRILVVEDDEDAALLLKHVLEKRGPFDVTHTPDPAAMLAMTAAAAEPWDLVITDLELPSMSGRELTGALRRLDPLLPVVLVTACEAAARGLACADAILIKPLRVDQLIATVNALISAMRAADLPAAAAF